LLLAAALPLLLALLMSTVWDPLLLLAVLF
jgi:hypothetical protein